jgi:hypothetical protein
VRLVLCSQTPMFRKAAKMPTPKRFGISSLFLGRLPQLCYDFERDDSRRRSIGKELSGFWRILY